MDDSRLACLIDSYIAGVLNADEQRELHEQLIFSPAARAQYDRHISSYHAAHPKARLPDATELLHSLNGAARAESLSALTSSVPEVVSTKLRAWCAAGAFTVCGAVGILLVVTLRQTPAPPFQPTAMENGAVAVLRHAANVRWLNLTNEMFSGDAFPTGRVQISAGALHLEFKRGARLVVEGPADLQLVSDNEAFLYFGAATAFVPESAHGFTLTAPAVAVKDLGTEFGVRAATNAPAELHVFSGLVEMSQLTREPRRLREGQAVQIAGSRIKKRPAARGAFLFEEDVARGETEEQHDRLRAWKTASQELGRDPAAVIHYTFEDQNEGATHLINAVPATGSRLDAKIVGSWTDGRWPDKHALAFSNKTDRIRFSVPNTFTSLTYMAWLRVDKLLNTSNALAITESGALGEVHWQIYRDGRVALSSHSGTSGNVDQTWDRGISPPLFTEDRFGKWMHLVSVYDSSVGRIKHYLNGEFVSSTPIKRPLPLKLGAVEIGNWGASTRNGSSAYLSRFWNGRIDEFALLARALSDEEIRNYYQRGRVTAGSLSLTSR